MIPLASMVFEQGVRITPFISPWSTMTTIESWPSEEGRLVIKVDGELLEGK